MRRGHPFPSLTLAAAVLAAVGALSAPVLAYRARNVMVVVIDGPRMSETFEDPGHGYIPRIWNELVPIGTRIPEFHNDGLTETVSGHASMLTGTWQELPDNGNVRPTVPTLFEYFRIGSGAPITDAWIVGGKTKLNACAYSSHPFYGFTYGASASNLTRMDVLTFEDFKLRLATDHPRLSLLSLSQADLEAHGGSWLGYVTGIARADSLVMDLWTWLEADPHYAGRTALFLTYDHGRHLDNWREHGDSCLGCVRIAFLALGPDFSGGVVIGGVGQLIDICPTVAALLGVAVPFSRGRNLLPEITGITIDAGVPPAGERIIRAVAVAPNPFNPLLRIRIDLAARAPLAIEVCDAQGRKVEALWAGVAGPGALALAWDGGRAGGGRAASGWYSIVVRSGTEVTARRAVLIR